MEFHDELFQNQDRGHTSSQLTRLAHPLTASQIAECSGTYANAVVTSTVNEFFNAQQNWTLEDIHVAFRMDGDFEQNLVQCLAR